ncbi:hypothetical protein K523DRAFT_348200 [Schizophyllum commune Tattone D]|nr:hypothetical protein K523DRAFT_348200 [Schizophyllum commune Tattone D]
MSYDLSGVEESKMIRMEWVFVLPRRGLAYYLRSRENHIPLKAGSEQLPVIECYAHPYSISDFADEVFVFRSTLLTGPVHALVYRIRYLWISVYVKPPRWFVNSLNYMISDEDLNSSEASGYVPLVRGGCTKPNPVSVHLDSTIPEDSVPKKCAHWALGMPPDAPPPEEDELLSPYHERRSEARAPVPSLVKIQVAGRRLRRSASVADAQRPSRAADMQARSRQEPAVVGVS